MSIDLEAIKARAEAATPGPWWHEWVDGDDWWSILGQPIDEMVRPEVATCTNDDDARYIAAANPHTVLDLIAAARTAETNARLLAAESARVGELEAEVARWTNLVSGIEYGGYSVEIGGVKLMGCDKTGRTEPENRLAELEAMRTKVLELHKRRLAWDSDHHDCDPSECDRAGEGEQIAVCDECSTFVSTVGYPCLTARVLGVTE